MLQCRLCLHVDSVVQRKFGCWITNNVLECTDGEGWKQNVGWIGEELWWRTGTPLAPPALFSSRAIEKPPERRHPICLTPIRVHPADPGPFGDLHLYLQPHSTLRQTLKWLYDKQVYWGTRQWEHDGIQYLQYTNDSENRWCRRGHVHIRWICDMMWCFGIKAV